MCESSYGPTEELVRDLREKMKVASEFLEFERAARLRDQILAIEEISVEQRVMEFTEADRDYIALAPCAESLVIVVLQVREGMLLGKEVFRVAEYSPDEEALSHFIARYYAERKAIRIPSMSARRWTRRISPSICKDLSQTGPSP